MAKRHGITRHSAAELEAAAARGESGSDWLAAGALSGAEIAAAVASDPDEAGLEFDWDAAEVSLPQRKVMLNLRVDADVAAYFRAGGKGYQTRMNAVLASYVRRVGR